MACWRRGSLVTLASCWAGYVTLAAAGAAPMQTSVERAGGASAPPTHALLDQYCVTCHNDKLRAGNLSLADVDPADPGRYAETLEKVVRKLRSGAMPPEGRPRPNEESLEAFLDSVEGSLDRLAAARPNPGMVGSRRLNRTEYVNAIEDLFGLRIDAADYLPSDMAGFGFDTNAEVLSITPGLMSRYMAAATKISRMAVGSVDNRPMAHVYTVGTDNQNVRMGEDMPFATRGGLAVRHIFPLDGEYLFQVRMKGSGSPGGILGIEREHRIELRVGRTLVKRFEIGGKYELGPAVAIAIPDEDLEGRKHNEYRHYADHELAVRVPIKGGTHLIALGFTDWAPAPGPRLGVGVESLQISGPFNGQTPQDTLSREKIFVCQPSAAQTAQEQGSCARQILGSLARRAYRRPVTDADIAPLLDVYEDGRRARGFETGIEYAIEAMLSSPKFLLRAERQPDGAKPGVPYRLTGLELATRLSFFLWKSIPDDLLLEVAARGDLSDLAILEQQVRRMLADRRSSRFMQDFVQQWLEVRNLSTVEPDPSLGFTDSLRKAMLREIELFFESQLREDRPIQELLRASYTFLNEELARHYGIDDVYGGHFRRVSLTDERRFGLLGKAGVLTVTSYADRTSVVVRGKWVLENLLASPPPPPPPNVPTLKENDDKGRPTSLRERMEVHRSNPTCAGCHSRMDPLGFALEHYDAIGRWRETDGGAEINAAISLHGETINSLRAFSEALLTHTDEFAHAVTEKLLTYALGRGIQYFDQPLIRQLHRDLDRSDYRWSVLVMGIVKSMPFRMRNSPMPNQMVPAATAVGHRDGVRKH